MKTVTQVRVSNVLFAILVVLCAVSSSLAANFRFPARVVAPWGGIFSSRSSAAQQDTEPLLASSSSLTQKASCGGTAVARGGASTVAVAAVSRKTLTSGQFKVYNLLSGGVAGTIASCITNPLEVVKTQLQSSLTSQSAGLENFRGDPLKIAQKILQTDGVKGFFKGLKPTLVGIIPAKSVYFYAYESTKRALSPYLPEGGVGNSMMSGLAAGVAGNTLTNPIWLVKTRMQLMADASAGQLVYKRYSDVISHIAREEGIGGFYKGISASYWGCTEGMIQFVLYEQIKRRLLERNNASRIRNGLEESDKLPKAVYFFSAAAAKGVASIATYPHEVARTRLREQARNGVFKYRGMWQTMGVIAREEGRSGLYAGMGVHLAKVIPNSAIMFLTYEVVNTWLSTFTISD
eukprot:scaffold23156_cov48-Attheya_sp.AAC.2